MNAGFGWKDLFFSAAGRAARTPSLIAAGVLIALAALYEAVVGPGLHWATGWLVYPPLFYAGACVLSKRLHDRGRSGWWAALVLVSIAAAWPHPEGFLDFLFVCVLIWAAVELAVMPGEAGTNRYGANPLRGAVAV